MGDPAAPPDAAEDLPHPPKIPLTTEPNAPPVAATASKRACVPTASPSPTAPAMSQASWVGLAHAEHYQSGKRHQRGRHFSKQQVAANAQPLQIPHLPRHRGGDPRRRAWSEG